MNRYITSILQKISILASIALIVLMLGCSGDDEISYDEREVEHIYNVALNLLQNRKYAEAAQEFDEVERQHPYSKWAKKAILMGSYAHYMGVEYGNAIVAAKRFITLYPGNKDAAYAYYLVAISYYDQIVDVGRDQRATELALNGLQEILRRYPNSEYAKDAKLKYDLTRDHLAGKEMEIGRWYLFQREYIAAANRFKEVIQEYQTTSHVAEALERLAEIYMALGIQAEAQTAAAILGHNFPGSKWYEDAYVLLQSSGLEPRDDSGTWLSQTWDNTVGGALDIF